MSRKFKVCLISILVCALLALFKYLIASFSGSLSLKADALHSLLDMMTSMLVMFSLALDTKTFKKPLLQKLPIIIKHAVFLIIIILTAYLGYGVFVEVGAIEKTSVINEFWVVFVCLVSIVASHFLFRYQRKIGMEEKSVLIMADAFETRIDQITSFLVLVAISGIMMGLQSENTFVFIILLFVAINLLKWIVDFIFMFRQDSAFSLIPFFSKIRKILSEILLSIWKVVGENKRLIRYSSFIVLGMMFLIYLLSGFYTLKPGQLAVIQYFGRYMETLGKTPGLNYAIPWPVGKNELINVDEIRRIEVDPTDGYDLRYFITKDENLIDASIALQYRIGDIHQYYFGTESKKRIIEDIVESVSSKVIGEFDVDDALVHKKTNVLSMIKDGIQKRVDKNELGISVLSIQFKNNRPPREVISAFNEVSSAREDKRTYVDRALEYQNKELPIARGDAYERVQKALAFESKVVENSLGDMEKLQQIYKEYIKSPYSYKSKTFLNLMEKISKKITLEVIDPVAAQKRKIRLYKN